MGLTLAPASVYAKQISQGRCFMNESPRSLVPALERGLAILEVLANSRVGLTLSQLTRYLDLPKSSVHCLLKTFEENGYLFRHNPGGKYRLTLRVSDLARRAVNGISLREQVRPHLRALAEKTGTTVHLGLIEQGSCVLIERIVPHGAYRSATWVGKQLGVHCTAIGKALAAGLSNEELERLVGDHGLMRYNDNTICSLRKLKEELALVRERGYSLDDEEEEIGVRCIGAPVFNAKREAIAAISIVGTTTQIHGECFAQLISQVSGAARRLSEEITQQELETGKVLAWGVPSPSDQPTCRLLNASGQHNRLKSLPMKQPELRAEQANL
jgi:DNA-binding IclR family transcriptional regulator